MIARVPLNSTKRWCVELFYNSLCTSLEASPIRDLSDFFPLTCLRGNIFADLIYVRLLFECNSGHCTLQYIYCKYLLYLTHMSGSSRGKDVVILIRMQLTMIFSMNLMILWVHSNNKYAASMIYFCIGHKLHSHLLPRFLCLLSAL